MLYSLSFASKSMSTVPSPPTLLFHYSRACKKCGTKQFDVRLKAFIMLGDLRLAVGSLRSQNGKCTKNVYKDQTIIQLLL